MNKMWADAFDRVVAIRFTGYRAEREPSLLAEFARVGLEDAAVRWTFPTPYTLRFGNSIVYTEGPGNFDETYAIYSELKVALALGMERILVLEDDVRFLLDTDMIRQSLEGIPSDFVDAKLSWIRRGGPVEASALRGRGLWVPTTGVVTRDTGAIAFSREGMEWFVGCVEDTLSVGGPPMRSCDLYDRPPFYKEDGARHYLAVPLVARQVQFGGRMSRISLDRYYSENSCMAPGGGAAYAGR